MAANPFEPDLASLEPPPQILLNLSWLCTKASRNLLRNPVEPDLALHQSLTDTFSGTPLNLTGACTTAHRSYFGLKTTLAYAVGEKQAHTSSALPYHGRSFGKER
jgi:hypothetical protein